jgi:hypothetical protein
MLTRAGLSAPANLLTECATILDAGADPFEGTGIIVVGSAKLADPLDKASELVPASYSQFGPGLCCLAPSDRDENPSAKPSTDGKVRFNYVPAPDILGHGGYAEAPASLASHHAGEYGFGGTSAASAQAAGIIARMIEARKTAGEAVDGASIRAALVAKLGGPYAPDRGYGVVTI